MNSKILCYFFLDVLEFSLSFMILSHSLIRLTDYNNFYSGFCCHTEMQTKFCVEPFLQFECTSNPLLSCLVECTSTNCPSLYILSPQKTFNYVHSCIIIFTVIGAVSI